MSFTGVEAPVLWGSYGLVGTAGMATLPPDVFILNENVAYESAEVVAILGSAKVNDPPFSGSPSVNGLIEYNPYPGVYRLVAMLADGRILRTSATGPGIFDVTLREALTIGPDPVLARAGEEEVGNVRKLFMTLLAGPVQVLNDNDIVCHDIGPNAPAEWVTTTPPRHLFAHAARLWGLAGDRAYFSSVLDHENFVDTTNGAGSQTVGIGVGERCESAVVFKEQVFIFKWPKGIFIYDTRDNDLTNWLLTELTRGLGIAGPRAVAVGGDEVLFVAETGHLHLLSNVRGNDVLASDLTEANLLRDWWKDNISAAPDALVRASVVFYPEREEFHVALPAAGATETCSIRVIVDMKRGSAPRIYTSPKDICQSLAIRTVATRANQLISGDNAGTVWSLDEDVRTKAGAAYDCVIRTPQDDFAWVDPALRTRRKNLAFLEIIAISTGTFTLTAETYLDGLFRESIAFPLSGPGAVLGGFVLGTDILGGSGPIAKRHRIRGSCRRLSIVFRFTTTAGMTFRLSGFIVSFTADGHAPV